MDIGIIGGADGPTSIIVAPGGISFWIIALAVIFITAAVFTRLIKKK